MLLLLLLNLLKSENLLRNQVFMRQIIFRVLFQSLFQFFRVFLNSRKVVFRPITLILILILILIYIDIDILRIRLLFAINPVYYCLYLLKLLINFPLHKFKILRIFEFMFQLSNGIFDIEIC
mmetsp:Transcript_2921/g.421  ORF Transcript_2921/g.421 Transcript_2921/m.421 type:complete len:122 (-) Transcript_2921:529-894(-)